MNVQQKTVSALVACMLAWAPMLYPAQGEVAPSSGNAPAPTRTAAPGEQPGAVAPTATAAPATQTLSVAETPAATGSRPPANAKGNQGRYVIGPLDVVVVKVWNQPQLSGAVNVGPDGMISLQLIGEVKADGLTALQLGDAIQARLKDCCLNNPQVDVTIGKINSKKYYVYGGVLKGGEFPLDEKITIMDALSLVGGFKDFAKPNKITITRGNQTFHFNYKDFIKGKNLDKNANIELQNGDRINVPE